MLRPVSTTNSIGQLSSRNRKTGANYNKQNLRRGQTGSHSSVRFEYFCSMGPLVLFSACPSIIVSARCDCPGTQGAGLGSARKQKKIEVQAEQKTAIKVQVSTKHLYSIQKPHFLLQNIQPRARTVISIRLIYFLLITCNILRGPSIVQFNLQESFVFRINHVKEVK